MIRIEIEPWKQQKTDFLGFIEGSPFLFQNSALSTAPGIRDRVAGLKQKLTKKETVENGVWVSWTGLVGHGERHEKIRVLASRFLKASRDHSAGRIGLLLNTRAGAEALPWVLEGLCLGAYRFDKYKSNSRKDPDVVLFTDPRSVKQCRRVAEKELAVLACVERCRDLANEPGNHVFPSEIVRIARKTAKKHGLSFQEISAPDLDRQGYQGLTNVGKGSANPPSMVVLRYRPRRAGKKHLALVGKGITFDSGGYCLKPPAAMWEMKTDMAGAATALYTVEAIARRKIPVNVTAILCLAENLVGGKAYRPGDIFKARNGKTVHVGNTDAEGRLVLTDGLHRAGEEKATHIVDIATLTGAMVVSLGMEITGLFGNSKAWTRALHRAASGTGEAYWEMPLHAPYRDLLKNPYADLNNIGNRNGGAIQAALFLQEFVPEKTNWIHLDIAGTSFTPKPWKYFAEGATGIGLRTLVKLAEQM